MSDDDSVPTITLRVPGMWPNRRALSDSLPDGCRLENGRLEMEGGGRVEVVIREADNQLPAMFEIACRDGVPRRVRRALDRCRIQACPTSAGGSHEAAERLLDAGTALLRAGGAGLFVDSSGMAHRPARWLQIVDAPRPDALVEAFVNTFATEAEIWSLGMHAMGLRDVIMTRSGDDEADYVMLRSVLHYLADPEVPVVDGDFIGSEPTFRFHRIHNDRFPSGTIMHNPYGEWRLERVDAPLVD